MKLTILLTMVAIFQVSAMTYSQTTKLTIKVQSASIKEVFNLIEAQSEFTVFYKDNQLDMNKTIKLDLKNATIAEVLNIAFANTNIQYKVLDKIIVIAKKDQLQLAVSGTVKDAKSGTPIPGVNIKIQGTNEGTITDLDGNYNLKVPNTSATISFSFIGYQTQIVAIDGRNKIDVLLMEETRSLDEVVVTALGIKREEKALGYAVQNVSGNTLATVKGIDISTSLTGKVSGLLVKNSTEFAAAPDVQIRGENPLLVIDGVPYGNMSLRDIPSDDIEGISVLKGATASALYGVRGQSGVLMVTTKKGTAKKGLTVSVNTGTMFTAGYLAIPETQSVYGRLVNTSTNTVSASGDGAWGVPLDGRMVNQWDHVSKSWKLMPYLPTGKDNFKNFIEQGYVLNNNISVVQQGEFGSFRSSVSWVKNKGQYPNSMFDKLTYNIGGDMKIDKFTLSSSITYNKQTSPNTGFSGYTAYDPMYNLLVWAAPDYDVRDLKDYWVVKNETQNTSYSNTNNNPYFDRNERIHSLNRDVFNGTLALNYELAPWLKATFRTGYDMYTDRQIVRISKGSLQGGGVQTVLNGGSQTWGESMRGSFNEGIGRGYSLNNDVLLSGSKAIGEFTIDALMGGTIFYKQDEGLESFTQGGLLVAGFYSLKASTTPVTTNSVYSASQINSLYGRLALSWNKLVYVDATYRNDWTSTLPKATRSYNYPSVSGSFIASELLPSLDWLSLWKFRGSYTTARKIPSPYEVVSVYNLSNNTWGTLSGASLSTTIRSADVRTEGSATYEVGTAINVLKNRASLDISYYSKRMFDPLVYAGSSPSTGFYNTYVNSGEEITRKGIEITANATAFKNTDWQWDISLNWSTYARYYTKIDPVYSYKKP